MKRLLLVVRVLHFWACAPQLRCLTEIENDMVWRKIPMDRLLCGDVGFGKTEVALRAMFRYCCERCSSLGGDFYLGFRRGYGVGGRVRIRTPPSLYPREDGFPAVSTVVSPAPYRFDPCKVLDRSSRIHYVCHVIVARRHPCSRRLSTWLEVQLIICQDYFSSSSFAPVYFATLWKQHEQPGIYVS